MQTQTHEIDEREQRPGYLSTEQLYRVHRLFVARFLSRLGVRPEALDDAVQEVFVTVHRRGGYVLGPAKPTSYLATIAVNTAAAQRRSSRRLSARRGEQEPEELEARGGDPGEAFETRQELHRLDRALSRLDPTLRDTLLAADGEGESCVAIADATSVPLGTVYWRLDRARKKFREALRVVDAPPRRRLGMVLACLGSQDWWRFGKNATRATSVKVATGVGVSTLAATLALLAIRDPAPVRASRPGREVPMVATSSVLEARAVKLHAESAEPSAEPIASVAAPSESLRARSTTRHRARSRRTAAEPSDSSVAIGTPNLTSEVVSAVAHAPVELAIPEAAAPPAPRAEPTREASETLQLARAEALLARHPREALALVRSVDARESANYLREERDYIEVMALLAIGEREAGQRRAQAFLRAYPGSAFARVVRLQSGQR